jgi:hypothetical protein
MFYEQSYNTFPTLLSFITKLNFNQLNILKNKIDENDFEKRYYKKRNTQKKLEKNHVRKNYINSYCFLRKNLYLQFLTSLIFKK